MRKSKGTATRNRNANPMGNSGTSFPHPFPTHGWMVVVVVVKVVTVKGVLAQGVRLGFGHEE